MISGKGSGGFLLLSGILTEIMSSHSFNQQKLIISAAVFAFLILIARIGIFYHQSGVIETNYLAAFFISITNEFLIGLFLSIGLIRLRTGLLFYLYSLFIILFIAFELACFHYEAVFGRLPGADLFYYLSELNHLTSSLQSSIPVPVLVTETIIITVIFFTVVYILRNDAVPLRMSRHAYRDYALLGLILTSVCLQTVPAVVPDRLFWGTREAAIWMLQSNYVKERYNLSELKLDSGDFQRFLYLHGQTRPVSLESPDYPLCAPPAAHPGKINHRNIIVLVLEGVGQFEMFREQEGQKLMPNLQRIAKENINFGTFYSAGTKSIQALPALFSGLPAQPHKNYLWKDPLINFDGFPNMLRKQGYKTVFMHGSDLSFERQRPYIQSVGFEEILEYDPALDLKIHGWGYDDGVMFDELKDWIESHLAQYPNSPYLASLFTLSTHNPYVLPPEWKPRFSDEVRVMDDPGDWRSIKGDENLTTALAETYAFLDYHLGKFYDWYRNNTENTLLFITGDHAPHVVNDGDGESEWGIRYNVPLIISGLTNTEIVKYKKYENRTGAMHDFPATVMGLLNQPPHRCNLGVNLLAPDNSWPQQRYIYSAGGDTLERIFIMKGSSTVIYDRIRNQFLNLKGGEISDEPDNIPEEFRNFYELISPVHYYLLAENAYFPVGNKINEYDTTATGNTIFVSHRGNVNGTTGKLAENSRESLDAAVDAGFEWVEIDIQITDDGIPVVLHDPYFEVQGNKIYINKLTLDELNNFPRFRDVLTLEEVINEYLDRIGFLIEIKPVVDARLQLQVTREVSRIVSNNQTGNKIIVDSFQEDIASSVKKQCECEVGFDTPYLKKINKDDLLHIKKLGFDWVYVHYSVIDNELVKIAHDIGLKVMAYTVNSPDVIENWQSSRMPDGIITDYNFIRERHSL